jgi:hypothetical protein
MGEAMELHVGRGISAGALTVFPVWNGDGGRRHYTTDVKALAVTELEGGPSVPGLTAVNQGIKPVLVLEGHLFEGGWQHRMATKSVVLAPGRPEVVEVACVEQRRWSGGTRQASRGRRATPYVRSGAHAGPLGSDAQGEVWRRVDAYRVGHVFDDTGSLVGHLDRTGEDVRRLTQNLRPLPGQAGVIVAIAGQPFMMEVFDDAQTLRKQFDSIIAAAGLDALGQPAVVTPSRRARRMVERLERMHLRPTDSIDDGARLHARDHDLDVSVLSWRGRPVHLRATFLRHPSVVGA